VTTKTIFKDDSLNPNSSNLDVKQVRVAPGELVWHYRCSRKGVAIYIRDIENNNRVLHVEYMAWTREDRLNGEPALHLGKRVAALTMKYKERARNEFDRQGT